MVGSGTRRSSGAACCARRTWSRRSPGKYRAACRARRTRSRRSPGKCGAACRAHRSWSRRSPGIAGAACRAGTSYDRALLDVAPGGEAVLPELRVLPAARGLS